MNNESMLREAVAHALDAQQVMRAVVAHLNAIERLDTEGKLAWKSIQSPQGSRSFDGTGEGYSVLVTQFNTAGHGLGHAGMAAYPSTGVAIVVPPDVAERLYRAIAARMN